MRRRGFLTRLGRGVLVVSVPLMASNLAQTLMSLTDTAMVGRLGRDPLAAIGPATVSFLIIFVVSCAFFQGMQTLVSRRFGEGDHEACGRVLDAGLVLSIIVGLVVAFLGYLCADHLAAFLIDDASIADIAGDYLMVRWVGILPVTIIWAYRGFYYGLGVTRLDMFITLGVNVLNIALNWVLIFGNLGAPALGTAGAAWATVIASVVATVVLAAWSFAPRFRIRYTLYRFGRSLLPLAGRIARLSIPRAVQGLAFSSSVVFLHQIAHHCSADALAASTIVWRFIGLTVLLNIAIGAGAATLVGQSLGAGKPRRAAGYTREAIKWAMTITGTISLIVIIFPRAVLGVFTPDTGVIEIGVAPLRLMCAFQLIDAGRIVLSRTLAGAGRTRQLSIIEIVVSLGILLPLTFITVRLAPDHLVIIWCSWAVYAVAWTIAAVREFRSDHWKHVVV